MTPIYLKVLSDDSTKIELYLDGIYIGLMYLNDWDIKIRNQISCYITCKKCNETLDLHWFLYDNYCEFVKLYDGYLRHICNNKDKCEDCKDTGKITLLNKVVDCDCKTKKSAEFVANYICDKSRQLGNNTNRKNQPDYEI